MGIGRGDLVVFQFLSEWARQIPSLQSNLFLSAAAPCGAVPRLAVNEPEDGRLKTADCRLLELTNKRALASSRSSVSLLVSIPHS
jgi:hypothetical protein